MKGTNGANGKNNKRIYRDKTIADSRKESI